MKRNVQSKVTLETLCESSPQLTDGTLYVLNEENMFDIAVLLSK